MQVEPLCISVKTRQMSNLKARMFVLFCSESGPMMTHNGCQAADGVTASDMDH